MGNKAETVALALICHNRPDELDEALRSAEAEPFDERIVIDMVSDPPLEPRPGVRMIRSEENLGTAGGRNLLGDRASSDILVFLDDDAVFQSAVVEPVRSRFTADPSLAAIAFDVHRPDGNRDSSEIPFRGAPAVDGPHEATYFVGCGHAMRRRDLVDSGGYDGRFLIYGEEIDLGLTLVKRGRKILFDPEIVIEHRPSDAGRVPSGRLAGLTLQNRLLFCRRHLPWIAVMPHIFAWAIRSGLMALRARQVRPWFRAWRDGFTMPVNRDPLSHRALVRVHRLGGRVLW